MLDLDSGVHLEEVELALGVEKELDRAGADVVHGFGGAHRGLAHAPAEVRVDDRRGRFLDDFLVASLKRALPFPERDDPPVPVAQDLDLDVARSLDEALDVDGRVVEAGAGFGGGATERGLEFLLFAHQAHALAAAAGRGLEHHRIADLPGSGAGRPGVGQGLGTARHDRYSGRRHQAPALDLRPHGRDRLRGRADEDHSALLAAASEAGVLGQETVAGMDRVGADVRGQVDDLPGQQIALHGRRRTDAVGLVGHLGRQAVPIRLGVDGDGDDAALAQRPDDAHRDLAAVRDQHLLQPVRHARRRILAPRRLPGPENPTVRGSYSVCSNPEERR